MSQLQIVKTFVEEMANNSSTNVKKEILQRYADNSFLIKILQYTYHPLKQFYVTSKGLQKNADLIDTNYAIADIFSLLDSLTSREITGHDAIAAVNGYIYGNYDCAEIVYQIIDKNLKTRATETIINEVIPNCIPVFEVQLAAKFHEFIEKVRKDEAKAAEAAKKGKPYKRKNVFDFVEDVWFASYKLDGIRCVGIVDENGVCTFWTRGGNEILTTAKVKAAIEELGLKNFVFDGELCIQTEDETDDFQGIMKEWNKKEHTIENPKYYIFDFLKLDNFYNESDPTDFMNRLAQLNMLMVKNKSQYLAVLPQVPVYSFEDIQRLKQEALDAGREGLMLKRNTRYQKGRTNDILKAKLFYDEEYVVESMVSDLNRVIRDGREVEIEMLAAVYIRHKGDPVKVGSGFTQEQKIAFHADPSLIVGKTITVQYQEETTDQNGKNSLRFPVIKHIYENGRNA